MPKQTPLEKADELINKFADIIRLNYEDNVFGRATECALITAQEVIDSDPYQYIYDYWVLVKKELENML